MTENNSNPYIKTFGFQVARLKSKQILSFTKISKNNSYHHVNVVYLLNQEVCLPFASTHVGSLKGDEPLSKKNPTPSSSLPSPSLPSP